MKSPTFPDDLTIHPLLGPKPFDHSQQFLIGIPDKRKHIGPRAWYEALEQNSLTHKTDVALKRP